MKPFHFNLYIEHAMENNMKRNRTGGRGNKETKGLQKIFAILAESE